MVAVVKVLATLVHKILSCDVVVTALFAKHSQAVNVETFLQNFLNHFAFLSLFSSALKLLL